MKAMILAAGLGTRLRPLTDHCPKALIEIAGRTLLEITLSRLRAFGITEVIINVHHFADMVIDYLKSNKDFGLRIEISREEVLLDTGGGLKKAAWFFLEDPTRLDEPFLLHNVDVISTIDLARMLQFHKEHRALATLAVQARESSRYLLFDDHLHLRGRRAGPDREGTAKLVPPVPSEAEGAIPARPEPAEPGCAPPITAAQNPSGTTSPPCQQISSPVIPSAARDLLLPRDTTASEPAETPANCHSACPDLVRERSDERPTRSASPESHRQESAFSSHSPLTTRHSPLLESLAFSGIHIISPRLLPMLTEEGPFSIIPAYLRLAAQGEKILAFRADNYYWRDLGRPADLTQAALDLLR